MTFVKGCMKLQNPIYYTTGFLLESFQIRIYLLLNKIEKMLQMNNKESPMG